MLSRLVIQHLRNLRQTSLDGLGGVNLISGRNGSGKTSVLEAVHLLAVGRSFRTQRVRSVVTEGESALTVHARVRVRGGREVSLGVRKTINGETEARLAGERAQNQSQLARVLPVRVLNGQSFDLLTGIPDERRRFLNWGVFHVEPLFHELWTRYRKCLVQRNALLRRGKMDRQLTFWTQELAGYGERLTVLQAQYVAALSEEFSELCDRIIPGAWRCDLTFRRGWDEEVSLAAIYDRQLDLDLGQGFTRSGPHRCDILVRAGKRRAGETLSRGQQKLIVCSLELAQGALLRRALEASHREGRDGVSSHRPNGCIYLVDDLPSELDTEHTERICRELAKLNAQVWITAIDAEDVLNVWPGELMSRLAMFHVEHGELADGVCR